MRKSSLTITKVSDTSALWGAIQYIGVRLCLPKNTLAGKVVSAIQRHIAGGKERTLNIWHSSRQEDMPEKGVQRAATPLRTGRNLKRNTRTAVPYVASEKNLLKTISFHCQRVAQITSQTFSPCVAIATAKSGSAKLGYFNVYESPELLEAK